MLSCSIDDAHARSNETSSSQNNDTNSCFARVFDTRVAEERNARGLAPLVQVKTRQLHQGTEGE